MQESNERLPEEPQESPETLDPEPAVYDFFAFERPLSPPPPPPEPPAKKRSCWFTGLVLLVIVSLLASAVVSTIWVFRQTAAGLSIFSFAAPTEVDNGRIAYINQDGQVVTIDPEGNNGRLLTDANFRYQFPAWTPDGDKLAVIGRETIFLLTDEDEAGEPVSLYSNDEQNPFYLYWSPDGRKISFLTNDPRHGIGLRVVGIEDPQNDLLLATGSPFYWNWTGDSRQMLIHTGASGDDARLALLGTEAFDDAEDIAPPGLFQAPGISANGRYWAYAEDLGDGTSWLVVSDTESGEQWRERHTGMVAVSWSPDGAKLAFTNSPRERSNTFWGPLRLFDAETGDTRLLSDNTNLAFFWSPNGRYLATINTGDIERDFGTNVVEGENGRRPPLAKPNRQPNGHQFNLAVIDVETGEETQLMSFYPTTLFIAQFLPFFDQYALSHHIWSPGSDAIVLPVTENRESRVKIVPVNGDPVVDLGEGDMPFWSP